MKTETSLATNTCPWTMARRLRAAADLRLLPLLLFLVLAVLPARGSPACTITDDFTNPANWGTPANTPGMDISVGGGRMNYTSTSINEGGAAIPRNAPLLPTTQDWSMKVDVHLDPFTLTTQDQFCDVFLGFGKTGDWFNTHVTFEFGRGLWGSHNGYYIGDDVSIDGDAAPPLFDVYNLNLTSSESALRMDYTAAAHTITYLFDADGPAGGYTWVAQGTANLASGTYNLNLSPTDTFTIFLLGSSHYQTVAAGQAYLSNLEITVTCVQYTYTTNNGTITITGYTGSDGDVEIPTRIDGLPVTSIGNEAFLGCQSLTNLTIPDSVIGIGNGAFRACRALTNLTIGNGVTSIGDEAFDACSSLTGVTMGKSVTRIGGGAFSWCINLTSVTIPNSVTDIGRYAFYSCRGLTSVTIPDNVTNIANFAFAFCTSLIGVHFQGNAPSAYGSLAFTGDDNATVRYLPGTTGWGATFGDRPTAFWQLPYPLILTLPPYFGVQANRFGFRISWATNASVAVEASTSLADPIWLPLATNTITVGIDPLTDGWSYFSDPEWTNYAARFYRAVSLEQAQTYAPMDYYYPVSKGSEWVYDSQNKGSSWTTIVRMLETNYPLTCYSNCSPATPYARSVVVENNIQGNFTGGGGFTVDSSWTNGLHAGPDGWGWVGYDHDDGTELRFEPGFIFTNRFAPAQSVSITNTVYDHGVCAGQGTFSLQLVDFADVQVPAGNFSGCMHLKLVYNILGKLREGDEWWAKGVGPVKWTHGGGDDFETNELRSLTVLQDLEAQTADASFRVLTN
jgi:hypothetical protein